MSRRLNVLKAIKVMIQGALPGAEVIGLDGDEAAPARISPTGRVVIRTGDPGDPEVDLSPVTYNWTHRIPIEVAAFQSGGLTSEEALDVMLVAIGGAIIADRHLGSLCDWLDVIAPETDDLFVEGARPPRGADLLIVASYATTNPLD